jgi:hypothetical protein
MRFHALQSYLSRRRASKKRNTSKSRAITQRKRRRPEFEAGLEPRILLATINYSVGDPSTYLSSNPGGLLDGDIDLTLRLGSVRGTPMLQLVDMDLAAGGQVVGAVPFTEPILVNITGYSTEIDGHTEEFPESLLIDLGDAAGLNPASVPIGVTLDGIKGTLISLLQNDLITLDSSSSSLYIPASLDVTLNDGQEIAVAG